MNENQYDEIPPKVYSVRSAMGVRRWHADDAAHAREQHEDAFPDEEILEILCPIP